MKALDPQRRTPLLLALGFATAMATPLIAGGKPPAATIEAIRAAVSNIPESAKIAVVVAPADGGPAIFERNADMPLKPASVMKLFTTAAAVARFGPDFAFETRAFFANDELIVIGGGDPGFGDERLCEKRHEKITAVYDQWAEALTGRGVKQIERIVLDDTIYDQDFRNDEWPIAQATHWYQAPVGGLNINDNCVDVQVRVQGKSPVVQFLPPLPTSFAESSVKLGKATKITVSRQPDSDVFRVTGTVAGTSRAEAVATRRPTVVFGYALKSVLEEHGIHVSGDVVRRTVATNSLTQATPIGTFRTPLRDVVWRCNTFSQNMFAECLVKALAAYQSDGSRSATPGSWSAGTESVRTTLGRLGMKLSGLDQHDGSGLSHKNRASAADIVELLQKVRGHAGRDVFLASLARAGEDGSMKKRYAEFRGKLIGKTGTLDGVHGLAGYATRPDGSVLAFAVLINGPGGGDLMEKLCRAMVR